jgi:putative phosphoribosyl transferase
VFENREDAARQLAKELMFPGLQNRLVLGIPRGGVVTASVLALELSAELDVVLARKLRAPFQSEYAIGAIGEDNEVEVDRRAAQLAGADETYIQQECRQQIQEIARRQRFFRMAKRKVPIPDRPIILTDDGVATGATMTAAIRVIKAQMPQELIVAVPVAPPEFHALIRGQCDRVICLITAADLRAVGEYYRDFSTVTDAEVIQLLKDPTRSLSDIRAVVQGKTLLDF